MKRRPRRNENPAALADGSVKTRSGDAYTVLSKRAELSEGGVVLLYAYDIGRNQEEPEDTGVKS